MESRLRAWVRKREHCVADRLARERGERDSLFATFGVARRDVAFERSGAADADADETTRLDRASERVRRRIQRCERRMQQLRRRGARWATLNRALAPETPDPDRARKKTDCRDLPGRL